jgi:hypothetical protein
VKEMLKIENLVQGLFTLLLVGGIIACGIYKDTPAIVAIASTFALLGYFGEKAFAFTQRSLHSKLSYSEAVELSFLRQIREKVRRNENVSEELISISDSASNESDTEYEMFYGFGRPLPATAHKFKSIQSI